MNASTKGVGSKGLSELIGDVDEVVAISESLVFVCLVRSTLG